MYMPVSVGLVTLVILKRYTFLRADYCGFGIPLCRLDFLSVPDRLSPDNFVTVLKGLSVNMARILFSSHHFFLKKTWTLSFPKKNPEISLQWLYFLLHPTSTSGTLDSFWNVFFTIVTISASCLAKLSLPIFVYAYGHGIDFSVHTTSEKSSRVASTLLLKSAFSNMKSTSRVLATKGVPHLAAYLYVIFASYKKRGTPYLVVKCPSNISLLFCH